LQKGGTRIGISRCSSGLISHISNLLCASRGGCQPQLGAGCTNIITNLCCRLCDARGKVTRADDDTHVMQRESFTCICWQQAASEYGPLSISACITSNKIILYASVHVIIRRVRLSTTTTTTLSIYERAR
jgi:hypothetical protein